jgi:hypothetical protein
MRCFYCVYDGIWHRWPGTKDRLARQKLPIAEKTLRPHLEVVPGLYAPGQESWS